MNVTLDILICTYNRGKILEDCLEALTQQETDRSSWGIIVVNNYHKPLDTSLLEKIQSFKNGRFIEEPIPGLSRARNKGIEESQAEWIGFLDDDARVRPNYIDQAFAFIDSCQFDCFGGHIESWWPYGRPRWLDNAFGSKPVILNHSGELDEGYNWGSHIFIKKQAIMTIGGFPITTGVMGTQLGYGAENIVQDRLRKDGFIIGYDPHFIIDHAVLPHKLHLSWHLLSAYATGRDGRNIFKDQYTLAGFLKSVRQCLTAPIKAIYSWLFLKDFYWENMILNALRPCALLIGKLKSLF